MAQFRTGKHPARIDSRTLRFRSYLSPLLPTPPDAWNAISLAKNRTGLQPAQMFPMDANDRLGDCTIAAAAHAATIYSGLLGQTNIPAEADVVSAYEHLTGGPDTGLGELDVLNWWRQTPFAGAAILAYASVDPHHHLHVQQAICMFGALYVGINVPASAEADFLAGKVWDVPVQLTGDGHAIIAAAYDPSGLSLITWGAVQRCTWAWWDACVDEAYVLLPSQAQAPGYATGFDFAQLQSDLGALT